MNKAENIHPQQMKSWNTPWEGRKITKPPLWFRSRRWGKKKVCI